MSTILPVPQTFRLVDENGYYTPEFKRYLDDQLRRTGGVTGGSYTSLTDGPVVNWDLEQHPCAVVVLGGNRTLASPTNMVAGPIPSLYRLTVVQDAVGGRTLAWGGAYKFAGGTAPTVTAAANAVDEFVFDCDGTNMKLVAGAQDLR